MSAPSAATWREVLSDAKVGEVMVAPGQLLVQQGDVSRNAHLLVDGWAFRANALSDGRRQVTRFLMPHDLVGFHSDAQARANSSVEAITDCRFDVYARPALLALLSGSPSLLATFAGLFAEQECEYDNFALTVGRRTAEERIAWMILHLLDRSKRTSSTADNKLWFPVTQALLADALGLSIVHTNKTLALLKRDRLIEWTSRSLEVLDYQGLAELALYEAADEAC